jgi:hypothetical protein
VKIGSELLGPVYLDTSALVKLYFPEPDSNRIDRLLRGRTDLMTSDLAIAEIVSALVRRSREGTIAIEIIRRLQQRIMADVDSNTCRRLDVWSGTFREAERILLALASVPLRAADALHLALALSAQARSILTFDMKMSRAAIMLGLQASA